jgi:hypothetical protein
MSLPYCQVLRKQDNLEVRSFQDNASCSIVQVQQSFRGTFDLHHLTRPDDGGSVHP